MGSVNSQKKKQLVINNKKSTVMLINFSRTLDFPPELSLGGEELKVVRESKILGLTICDTLRWDTHIADVCRRAKSRVWLLRRMLQLDLDYQLVLDYYFKEIRTVL